MKKALIYSAILLSTTGAVMASCSNKNDSARSDSGGQASSGGSAGSGGQASSGGSAGSGGQASSGGSTSTGNSQVAGGTAGGASNSQPVCGDGVAGHGYVDGGLVQIGKTITTNSVKLDVGGYYAMSADYYGYCFTFADNYATDGSSMYPPCGTGECFTADSGLCPIASLGTASGSSVWGGGLGCNLGQKQGTGTYANGVTLAGKTSLTVEVYGCQVPNQLQVQLNINNPSFNDAGVLGSGYFCNVATLSNPDVNGRRNATVQFSDLKQDCWNPGVLPTIDPATMTATSIQVQVNSDPAARTDWDFCISKLSID